jgi:hypothetical protein
MVFHLRGGENTLGKPSSLLVNSYLTRDATLFMMFHLREGENTLGPSIFSNRKAKGVGHFYNNCILRSKVEISISTTSIKKSQPKLEKGHSFCMEISMEDRIFILNPRVIAWDYKSFFVFYGLIYRFHMTITKRTNFLD